MANYISGVYGNGEQGIRNGSLSAEWELDPTGIRKTGSVSYIVVADSKNTSEEDIRLTIGIPRIGQLINGFWCQKIKVNWYSPVKNRINDNETWAWLVICEFSNDFDLDQAPRNQDGTINTDGIAVNPIYLPAKFSIHNETTVQPFEGVDADGNDLVNALGRPYGSLISFEPEVEEETSVIQIERWGIWPVPISQVTFYNNTTNSVPFHGLPARTCLMRVRVRKAFWEGVPFAREQYTIKVRIDREDPSTEGTWGDLTVPHVSDIYRKEAGGSTFSTRDKFGRRRLFYIRSNGTLVDDEDDIEYLTFKAKRSTDWTLLNLPNA